MTHLHRAIDYSERRSKKSRAVLTLGEKGEPTGMDGRALVLFIRVRRESFIYWKLISCGDKDKCDACAETYWDKYEKHNIVLETRECVDITRATYKDRNKEKIDNTESGELENIQLTEYRQTVKQRAQIAPKEPPPKVTGRCYVMTEKGLQLHEKGMAGAQETSHKGSPQDNTTRPKGRNPLWKAANVAALHKRLTVNDQPMLRNVTPPNPRKLKKWTWSRQLFVAHNYEGKVIANELL